MTVPSVAIKDWDSDPSTNDPQGTSNPRELDNSDRAIQAGVRLLYTRGTIASASTMDIGAEDEGMLLVTGTTAITSLGTVTAGIRKKLLFQGVLTFTHDSGSLILPTGANITTEAGDTCEAESEGGGNWRVLWYYRKSGSSLSIGGGIVNGSAAAPGLYLLNSPTTGLYRVGADQLGFSAAGTLRLTVSANALTSTVPIIPPNGTAIAPGLQFGGTAAGAWYDAGDTSFVLFGNVQQVKLRLGTADAAVAAEIQGTTNTILRLYSEDSPTQADAALRIDLGGDTGPDTGDGIVMRYGVDGTPNTVYRVRWDGAVFSDGAYSSAGADYAEAFLPFDPTDPPRPGDPVVLIGDRVRRATWDDDPADIIGIVSDAPSAIGDSRLLSRGGVVVGLLGKLRLNPGAPTNPRWRRLAGDLYLLGV